MLELDEIQHFLLARPRALAARYGFLTFRQPAGGRAWLSGIIDEVGTGRVVGSGGATDSRWVTVAFTWNGLRALGVPEASLATFPEEFRQGMAARAEILGDTGANHPDSWVGGLASSDLHAIVILFASDVAERERCVREHQQYAARFPDVTALSTLDLEAIPPLGYAHEHFGYRDRLTTPAIEGIGDVATPGSGPPLKAGEFFLGYPDESGVTPGPPQPEILSRNGSFLAYRRFQQHVGAFRDFLRQHGQTPEGQELIAAKLMGRWRSGAPLVLAPDKDDPALGADMQRNRSLPSSVAPASSASSSLRKTCGSMIGLFTSSATSVIRSSARRTGRWSSKSRSGRSGRSSKACRPSPPSEAAPTSSSRASKPFATSQDRRTRGADHEC